MYKVNVIDEKTNKDRKDKFTARLYGCENPSIKEKNISHDIFNLVNGYLEYVESQKSDGLKNDFICSPMTMKRIVSEDNIWIRDIIGGLFSYRIDKSQNELFYSFFHLLAIVFDFKKFIEISPITKIEEYKVYNATDIEQNSNVLDRYEDFEDESGYSNSTTIKGAIDKHIVKQYMEEWSSKISMLKLVPMNVWSNIWTRFYESLIIFGETKNEYLGEIINRQIVLFLNAILTEELLFSGQHNSRNYSNPTNMDRNFVDRIKKRDKAKDEKIGHVSPLFDFVFSCPLWGLFIDHNKKDETTSWVYYYLKQFEGCDMYENILALGVTREPISKVLAFSC